MQAHNVDAKNVLIFDTLKVTSSQCQILVITQITCQYQIVKRILIFSYLGLDRTRFFLMKLDKISWFNSLEYHPDRDDPLSAFLKDPHPAPLLPHPVHDGEAAVRPDTPAAGLSSAPGAIVREAPRPLSESAESATLPAGADGESWWRNRGPVSAGIPCLDSGCRRVKIGGTEVESRAAGSRRPVCGREGEPRNKLPGLARTAETVARSERSQTVRLHGPVNKKTGFIYKSPTKSEAHQYMAINDLNESYLKI